MIKFKNIDENGNKKIYFSRNDGPNCTLLPKKSLHSQELDEYHAPSQNRSGYQKVFPNSIKPAGYTGSRRKPCGFKRENIVFDLDFATAFPENREIDLFYLSL